MKLVGGLLFSVFFLLASWVFAQDPDRSSYGPGVLVSSSIHPQVSDQDNSNVSSQNTTENSSDSGKTSNSSTDEIVIKSTNAIMLQITENMKLTQDQINIIRPIIEDNIVQVRDLQLSLEKGKIDGKTMYSQRQQFNNDEDQKLGRILTADQMKVWMKIQNPSY